MKLQIISFLFLCLWGLNSSAGNGVERGRVVLGRELSLDVEITKYIGKKMVRCTRDIKSDYFVVNKVKIEEDEVDQGIVDLYYTVDLDHKNKKGQLINKVSVEVEDADYSNWRKYEEKLSLKLLRDKNKLCH